MKLFEVGTFYNLSVYNGFSPVICPALCTEVKKKVVKFKHLYRDTAGTIRKGTVTRRLRVSPCGTEQVAYVPDMWTTLRDIYASERTSKPSMWDDVQEEA